MKKQSILFFSLMLLIITASHRGVRVAAAGPELDARRPRDGRRAPPDVREPHRPPADRREPGDRRLDRWHRPPEGPPGVDRSW